MNFSTRVTFLILSFFAIASWSFSNPVTRSQETIRPFELLKQWQQLNVDLIDDENVANPKLKLRADRIKQDFLEKSIAQLKKVYLNANPLERPAIEHLLFYFQQSQFQFLLYDAHWQLDPFNNPIVNLALAGKSQAEQSFARLSDFEAWLKKLNNVPELIQYLIKQSEENIKKGMVQNKGTVELLIHQIESLKVDVLENSIFYAPLNYLPAYLTGSDKEYLILSFNRVIKDKIHPSLEQLLSFLKNRYVKSAYDALSIQSLAGGSDLYEALLIQSGMSYAQMGEFIVNQKTLITELQKEFVFAQEKQAKQNNKRDRRSNPLSEASVTMAQLETVFYELDSYRINQLKILADVKGQLEFGQFKSKQPAFSYHSDHEGLATLLINQDLIANELRLPTTTELVSHSTLSELVLQKMPLQQSTKDFSQVGINPFARAWKNHVLKLAFERGHFKSLKDQLDYLSWQIKSNALALVDAGIHAKQWSIYKAKQELLSTQQFSDQEISYILLWISRYPNYFASVRIIQQNISAFESQLKRTEQLNLIGDLYLTLLSRRNWYWAVLKKFIEEHPTFYVEQVTE